MPWDNNNADKRLIKGRNLQTARKRLFSKQPLCVECLKHGRTTIATIRDHIVPLAEGGKDTEENTQALCQECSDIKSEGERLKGLGHKARGCGADGVPLDRDHHWRK